MVLLPRAAFSQALPDAGSILRDVEKQQHLKPLRPAPHAVPAVPKERSADEVRFIVRAFRLSGVTLLAETEVQAVLAPWINKEIGFGDLEAALNAVMELYQRHGWFARPQLPEQDIGEDGAVLINVIEGRLGGVRLDEDSSPKLKFDRVLRTLTAHQKIGDPLNLHAMERSIGLINDMPGIGIRATLAPGNASGESDIVVNLIDKGLTSGTLSIDNTGSLSTGAEHLNVSATLDNPAGWGDQLSVSSTASQGMTYGRLGYALPVGYDGWRVGVSASTMRYNLIGSFSSLKSWGTAQTMSLTANYPLYKRSIGSTNLSLGIENKSYLNEANSIVTARKQLLVTSLGVGGDYQDGLGSGGISYWNLTGTAGYLDLSDVPANQRADRLGPRTEGRYVKFAGSLSRLQRITEADTLFLSLSGQWSLKNLDTSEQFTLGGAQGVRAYPTSEGSGDSGWLGTIEARHSFNSSWLLSVFYDHGLVIVRRDPSYLSTSLVPNRYSLEGVGASLSYTQASKYSVRLTLSQRLGNNPAANATTGSDSDGSRKIDRVWLSGVAYF